MNKKNYPRLTFLMLLLAGGTCLLNTSCSDALKTNTFCSLPAKFSFSPVSSMSPLYTSCNSQGEWCTIVLQNEKFVFTNLTTSSEAPRTAVQNYSGFYMGLSGFIAGLPNMPELGYDYPIVTCYDLACSNCYINRSVCKPLTLQTGGFAHCSACDLTYNLNNQGIVSDVGNNTYGFDEFRQLYRYRVYYSADTFVINN